MRFFFHIADKYGVSADGIGHDYADQDAAVLHAQRLATELARAGEFFRGSVVLVARATMSASACAGKAGATSLAST
jgi:hypothetical protein